MITPEETMPHIQEDKDLTEARLRSPLVQSMLLARATKPKIILELVNHIKDLMDQVVRLDGIAPKIIKQQDGKELIWRCPENLIPEERRIDFGDLPTL